MAPRPSRPRTTDDGPVTYGPGEFVVEYAGALPPGSRRPRRRSIGGVGVFFLGMFAQVVVLGALGAVAWFAPDFTSRCVAPLAERYGIGESMAGSGPEPAADSRDEMRRVEILRLEDRAVCRGDRSALVALLDLEGHLKPDDPDRLGVEASLLRIRNVFAERSSLVPPVLEASEVFPSARTEADLPLAALVQVLLDGRQSEAKRRRAAYLLKEAASSTSRNALFQAIQQDASLAVVQEAFLSFQELTGYPGENGFDSQEIAQWWSRHASSLGQR